MDGYNNYEEMTDKIIKELLKTSLWRLKHRRSYDKDNLFHLESHMKGFMSGRYRMEITRLKRKSEGKIYKIAIYWTPYNPYNLERTGRFNTYNELTSIIDSVNKDLLDSNRVLK